MNTRKKFWITITGSLALVIVTGAGLTVFIFHHAAPGEKLLLLSLFKRHYIILLSTPLSLLILLWFALDLFFQKQILPLFRLIEETSLFAANPSHRIHLEASRDVQHLVRAFNGMAERFETLQNSVRQQIDKAMAETEKEKNILAAIMAELPEGVLICNARGRILLYNNQARQLLAGHSPEEAAEKGSGSARFIGLGRSIHDIISKNLIDHALSELSDKLDRKEKNVASYFVMVSMEDRLLRAETFPIVDGSGQFSGFILVFYDITQQLKTDKRLDLLLQSFTRSIRASLAGIQTAIETIREYPDMDAEQLKRFRNIIHSETTALGNMLDKTATDYSIHSRTPWPLIQMLTMDMVEIIRRKAREKLAITIDIDRCDTEGYLFVDSYSFTLAILFVISQISAETDARTFLLNLQKEGGFIHLELFWKGNPIRIETLRKWNEEVLIIGKEWLPLTLKEILEHHGAEIWSHPGRHTKDESCLRFYLPAFNSTEPFSKKAMTILPESRPEFYDFDLFGQAGQRPELEDHLLTALTYTVFDTETTGLNPRGGDEIISIGAFRIVNGRLLGHERFDQLVDPGRAIPIQSIRIHGIEPEMVKGKPTIDKVLPLFHRFAGDTVLVAHNAAFDMRMLQIKETQTGVRFSNPVLDTLLLSAVLNPTEEDHTLEALANRFGVKMVDRHSALGDAFGTGELFIKMIPLLADKGIRTLKEAIQASRKTLQARYKF